MWSIAQISRGLLVAGVLAGSGLSAFAQAAPLPARGASTPHIQLRQAREQKRIDQGTAAGTLSPTEAQHLDTREQHVDNLESKAEADGSVTGKERARIRGAERRTSRGIARDTHN